IGTAGDKTTVVVLVTLDDRVGNTARAAESKCGHRTVHDAVFRAAAMRRWRRRSTKASMIRSGVAGSVSRSMPIAFATALTKAGGNPANAPSLASLAPKGPHGSLLSTIATSMGGDSTIVGTRYSSRLAWS